MNKLNSILKKNLLILLMSKWWVLVVIIGPLLVIFLSGIAFDNLNEYRLNIGVYSPTYNELTNSFISKLNTDEFRTVKANSEVECIDYIKLGVSHACIIFPLDLELGAENKELTIFIDYSKLNLAWVVRDRLFSRVEERSAEITKQLTDNLLSKLLIVKNEISNDLPLVVMISENEQNITTMVKDTLLVVGNTTYRLNMSRVDKLESGISSMKAANREMAQQSEKNIDFAQGVMSVGDFSDDEYDKYLSDISKRRNDLKKVELYLEQLYNGDFLNSVNSSMKEVKLRTNTSNMVISMSEETLIEILGLSDSNNKMIRRVKFSVDNAKKELENVGEFSAEYIAAPVVANIKPITSYNTNLNYIFPTLMAMSIMLAALLLSAIIVVMELNSPAFFRNVISPTKDKVFFFTNYLTNLILAGVQIALMMLVSMIFFFYQIINSIFSTIFGCVLIATFFIVLGMGIGYLFKTEQTSILAATFTASIFLFLSNILAPIENMPVFFMKIVQFNPFIISVSLLRKIILFNQPLTAVFAEIGYLLLLTAVLLLVYFLVHYKKENKKFFS